MEPVAILVLLILFVATLTQSTFGFGNALISMPLLSLLVDLEVARPLVALMATTIAAGVVVRDYRQIQLLGDWPILVGCLLGIPFGFWAALHGPESAVKAILAVVLIGFALFRLRNPRNVHFQTNRWASLFGFSAGILGGAYNTYGAPIVVYGTLRRWDHRHFRATLQGLFVPIGTFVLFLHWQAGAWTPHVLWYYLLGLPFAILGLWMGRLIHQRLSVHQFFVFVYVALILLGLSLLVQVFWVLLC